DGVTQAWSFSFPQALMPPPPANGEEPFISRVMAIIGDEPYDAAIVWNPTIGGYDITVAGLGSGNVTPSAMPGATDYIVQWTFDTGKVPAKGVKFAARFTTDATRLSDKVYALFGMKFPCDDYMAMAVYKAEKEGNFILDLQYKKKGVYYQQSGYPVEFSLNKGTVNGAGVNIYVEEMF
ncbi:hypothetical protein ACYULU_03390, partial [Breznakiellaceae bacterium SP9]